LYKIFVFCCSDLLLLFKLEFLRL